MSPVPPRRPRAALAFVVFSICLDALAQSTAFPILPRLAQHLVGGDPASTARWVGWLEVGWALPQFLAAPLLGMLSDRLGRRPVIVASLFGVGAELILNAVAPNIWWLLAGRVLCGFTCGAQAAAMAYVADISAPEDRTRAFAWMGAAPWFGVIAGPAAGGLLALIGLRAPFWAAAAVALAAGAYGLLVLPESLPPERRTPMRWLHANPVGALALAFGNRALAPLSVALLLCWLAFQGKDNMLVLYTTDRYGWSALTFGLFVAFLAGGSLVTQTVLAARIAARIGDKAATLVGFAFQALGMALMGLAPTGLLFSLANIPAILGVSGQPALQSMMSKAVGADQQGRLQGAVAAITSFTSIAAPVGFTQTFAWSIGAQGMGWSGLTILIAAALTLAALGLVALAPPVSPGSAP
jgi:DHA1 family tetracycline resistance protein-like MFS transporter